VAKELHRNGLGYALVSKAKSIAEEWGTFLLEVQGYCGFKFYAICVCGALTTRSNSHPIYHPCPQKGEKRGQGIHSLLVVSLPTAYISISFVTLFFDV